jgi:serine/threonine-protein kinase
LHGDVKPDNIIVSPRGHATLIDLGFARRIGERVTSFDDCLRFTATYASPEITSSHGPDVRSDLYSLGVTLYETLSGHPPFYSPRVDELLRMHREDRPQDLRMLASDVPGEVAKLVQQLLSKDPLRRPQSAADLADELINLEIATFDQR